MHRFLTAAALALLPGAVLADACSDPQTTMEMRECAGQLFQAADAELNAAYKEARAAAGEADELHGEDPDSGAVAYLRDAQRAWITLRDAQCALDGFSFRGGSMEPVMVTHCMTELSEKRAKELLEIAQMLRL